jgi:antitoxin (DNA-binding transcriptional repressor) of toxin-antitoxin stability system
MTRITISEIQQDVAAFLQSVRSGESIVISQDDQPIAEIRPIKSRPTKERPVAQDEGELIDRDDSHPEDIHNDFDGYGRPKSKPLPEGTPLGELVKFAGCISHEDLMRMQEIIEEGCERVDPDEW